MWGQEEILGGREVRMREDIEISEYEWYVSEKYLLVV